MMKLSLASVLLATLLATVVGCASASDPPLGGPYGGTAGAATTTDTNATDPTGEDAGTTSSASSSSGSASSSSSSTSSSSGSSSTTSSSSSSGSTTSSSGSSGSTTSSSGTSGTSTSSSGSSGSTAPTWTAIYTDYLAAGTVGNCGKSGCHSQMSTASKGYTWLQGKGYITSTNASLASSSSSILSWLGGDMPPSGPTSNAAAASDLTAWAAAGAPNN